ncbi:ATP-binding protein [Mammaliicoccus fleurettii]|uniref:ATP-binding protein n=1 Tax=Mammaliicoccus fleurettii TaxID=150056 RepID=UPI002DB642CF|nr:ATP-binding protein [Mammaliicoccus fleurettii]MEB7723421.1 ATP-binding protein [Mammaliicoccus fleurettii]
MNGLFNPKLTNKLEQKTQPKLIDEATCEKCGRDYEEYQFKNGYTYRLGCDCKMIEQGKEMTKNFKQRQKQKEINKILSFSSENEETKNATFETYIPTNENQAKAKVICERYASSFNQDNKQSLLLQGSFGLGKSHLAMSVLKEVKDKNYSVLFINLTELISKFRSTFDKDSQFTESELEKAIGQVDLMVFDDFGMNVTDYGMSKLFQIAESRVGKHNIITTNLSLKELTKTKDQQRLFSRLMSNTTGITLEGDDHRMKGFRNLT